jgi:putative transposase
LKDRQVLVSIDGRGRALDNVFIERLWRSVKYEDIYLNAYADGHDLQRGLERHFAFYNQARPHSALDGRAPAEAHGLEAAGSEGVPADSVWTARECRERLSMATKTDPLPAGCPPLAPTHSPVARTAPHPPKHGPSTPAAQQQQEIDKAGSNLKCNTRT